LKPAPATAGFKPDPSKPFYGLTMHAVNGWTATWEPDTVGIYWKKPGNISVSMTLAHQPIMTIDDFQQGFLSGSQGATGDGPNKAERGWWEEVTTKDGHKGFEYAVLVGDAWFECSTTLDRDAGDKRPAVDPTDLATICEGFDMPK
jgi:hypothetical protein